MEYSKDLTSLAINIMWCAIEYFTLSAIYKRYIIYGTNQDLDLPYGQHRWVEYANIHNYDASMIQPE